MSVTHRSIGENSRVVEEQEKAAEQRKQELVERFIIMPWRAYRMDQLSVWAAWVTAVASIFLYCTVSAVMLAVQ